MGLACPFPECNKSFDSFIALKAHVMSAHASGLERCPACGKKPKFLVKHLWAMSRRCREHAKFYVLLRKTKRNGGHREAYNKFVEEHFLSKVEQRNQKI